MRELAVGDYENLAEGIYLEGLGYDFGRDVIWYSDVIKGGIHGVKPDGSVVGSFNNDRMYTGGVMMKGKSGSGVAEAAVDTANKPNASALRVAARRELDLTVSSLNMCRPCLVTRI